MSLLPSGVYANPSLAMFVLVNASSINANNISTNNLNASTIYATYISSPDVEVSSIYATVVDVDFQRLTATPTELLLNGVPIATLNNISSIADWAFEPAISTVNMNGNNIINLNNVNGVNAIFQNLVAYNALFVSTQTSTISTVITLADFGAFSTLSCSTEYVNTSFINEASISTLSCTTQYVDTSFINQATVSNVSAISLEISTINGLPISFYEPGSVSTVSTFVTLNTSSLTVSSINGEQYVSGSNWSQYPATQTVNMNGNILDSVPEIHNNGNILIYSGNDNVIVSTPNGVINMGCESMNITADEGANITTNATVNITAKNGFQGEVNITADTGFADIGGVVNVLAKGGVTPLGVAYGGEVNITATTGTFTSLALTSAVNLNAAGINSYAGVTSPIGSLAGGNFVHGDSIVNITAGVPPIFSDPLCVYLRGTNGILMDSATYNKGPIRPYSDLLQNPTDLYIEDYNNGLSHGYIQLRGVSTMTFAGGDTAILGLNRVAFSSIGGEVTGLSSINGLPIGIYENISSISSLNEWALYPALSTIDANGNNIVNAKEMTISSILIPGTYSTNTQGIIEFDYVTGLSGGQIKFNTSPGGSTCQLVAEHHPPAGGASLLLTVTDENYNYSDAALRGLYFGTGLVSSAPNGYIIAGPAGLELNLVSSINNAPYPPSAGSQVSTALVLASTISTAYIQGANPNLFGLGLQGLEIDAANLFLSTPNVTHPGFFNGSTIAVNLEQARIASISSATISTMSVNRATFNEIGNFNIMSGSLASINGISTFELTCGREAIFQSTILADAVSTTRFTASSITLYGGGFLSTIIVPQATPNPGVGTSTCLFVNTDLNLGNNDLYAQQIRLGRGQVDNFAEILMYGNDGSTKNLLSGTADRTFRIASSAAPTGPGYVLDTTINAPFFSTINASTAMMAYFPSTIANTIGVSTISVIPPINYFGSWYSSTSQTVIAANTITPLTFNSESLNIGGFTYSGSTINVPVGGVYEITHSVQFATTSGGTNLAQFFPLKNGAVVPQTNSIVSITNNGDTLGTISFFDTAVANDKYGIAIYSSDNNMTANAIAAGATPAVPSIITNIKRL